MNQPIKILKEYWKYPAFRAGQESIIQNVLDGKDTLALLPTGGGKSICFQVPALILDGMCLVITPLIALMQDQVKQLNQRGIKAVALYTGLSRRMNKIIIENCLTNTYQFLYISPERIQSEYFQSYLKNFKVGLIAIDESHCISQWGYDFRPAYLKINSLREFFPQIPFIALTASATPEVQQDIVEKLNFSQFNVFKASFLRDNLSFSVLMNESKMDKTLRILNKVQGSGLVYTRNRKRTKEMAAFLMRNNISADYYHAGLSSELRAKKQQDWIDNKTRIICCTNAFGMGIDKPDVRIVVHIDAPDSLEAYYQEAGRAGRDGKKAYAVWLFNTSDQQNLNEIIPKQYLDFSLVKNVYESIAYYLKLAQGIGEGLSFDFDLIDFSNKFNFEVNEVFFAIKWLEKEELLSFSEGVKTKAKVQMIADKGELYKFQVEHPKVDPFVKLLLRSYAGMFNGLTSIDEKNLAKTAKTSIENIRKYLIHLHQQEIIVYEPAKEKPFVTYLKPRQKKGDLILNKKLYNQLKEAAKHRIQSVLEYIDNQLHCRQKNIVGYFGEQLYMDCEICDNCLKRKAKGLNSVAFERITDDIKRLLLKEKHTLAAVPLYLKQYKEDKVLECLEYLVDNHLVRFSDDNKLIWQG